MVTYKIYIQLDFGTVLTGWYFLFFLLDFGTVLTGWYFLFLSPHFTTTTYTHDRLKMLKTCELIVN
jgi:hypothetical protein